MQIFVKKPDGKIVTLNVESCEMISSVKRKLEVKEGIPSDVLPILYYVGKQLDDWLTLAHYNILNDSTLQLLLARKRLPRIFVETESGKIITLRIVGLNTIDDIKAKIYEQEGIPPDKQCLIFDGRELDGNQRLLENHIGMESTLRLVENHIGIGGTIMNCDGRYKLRKHSAPQVNPQQTKRARPATQTGPTEATPDSNSIIETNDGEVCAEYMQALTTYADPKAMSEDTYEAKLNVLALHQAKASAALSNLMPEFRARRPPSVLTELEDVKREMAQKNEVFSGQRASFESEITALKAENKRTEEELTVAHNNERELEATISVLEAENEKTEEELTVALNNEKELEAIISGLEGENEKTKEELTIALNNEKELEATISRLKAENEKIASNREKELETTISGLTAQCASYESQIVALEADGKKTKEVLMVAHSKEKKLEATISVLTHKNKVFSAQCTSYESQVIALEAENKKTKEELMNADKKLYAGARAAGYAEGLKEGKAKWLKSVEFLHHLTDASMQYFNYGFESCQKQADQQGFVGQLNRDAALMDAPELKGWESCVQRESGRNT